MPTRIAIKNLLSYRLFQYFTFNRYEYVHIMEDSLSIRLKETYLLQLILNYHLWREYHLVQI